MFLSDLFSGHMVHNLISPHVSVIFWTGIFLVIRQEKGGGAFLARRSPNLTPIDFFFWSFVKDTACREKAQSTN